MKLKIADRWFTGETIDGAITLLNVTMERLAVLPVSVVHAGHDPSMTGDRYRTVIDDDVVRAGVPA